MMVNNEFGRKWLWHNLRYYNNIWRKGKYCNVMFQIHLFSYFLCSVMDCKHVMFCPRKWGNSCLEKLCCDYTTAWSNFPFPSLFNKKKLYFDKHLVTSCPLIVYIWSSWPPQPAYTKLIFHCNIYTFQRDKQCCSTDCLLMLRCQLYMFRTVTVHPQELLFRCCMYRLWCVVRTALSDISR